MENNILATVNGREITERDLEQAVSKFPPERQGYFNNEQGRKYLLDQIISFELMYNHGKESGLEESQEYLANLEMAKKDILIQTTISKLLSEVTVSEEEVKDYYNANIEKFNEGESVTAKHILVDTEEVAADLYEKIENGMSFEYAALKFSSCPSKDEGGNLGTFTRGKMVPEFEDAAFSLEVGVVSKPVKTQFGYHLIKVEEKKEGSTTPFEQVKESIYNNILQERQNYKYLSANEELKKKFVVTVNI